MKRFRRKGRGYQATMEEFEIGLLTSLCGQLVDLLGPEDNPGAVRPDDAGSDPDDSPGAIGPDEYDELDDVIDLHPPAGPGGDDPFALWEDELDSSVPAAGRPTDPVLLRLFPDAYPDDPRAAAEFRRFTEADQRQRKVDDALTVLACLQAADHGRAPVRVGPDEVDAWLRTLTALRLVLAGRLGIDAEHPSGVPDAVAAPARDIMQEVYEWLAYVEDTLLTSL